MRVARLTLGLAWVMAGPLAAQGSLDRIGWLAGCWVTQGGARTTFEQWSPPAGGMMLGASRTVAGGQVRSFEHLRLRQEGDVLVYTALPSGQRETDFRSTLVSDTAFVVENPAHDFPQRISYRRAGATGVVARVEGPGRDGVRGFDIAYQRTSCEAAAPGGRE